MNRADLRKKGIDIVIHPVLIGLGEGKEKKAYTYSIIDYRDEIGKMEENPDFETYEEAEQAAVDEAIMWVQINEN